VKQCYLNKMFQKFKKLSCCKQQKMLEKQTKLCYTLVAKGA